MPGRAALAMWWDIAPDIQARQAQQACGSAQQQGDQGRLREVVAPLEQASDRPMQACRNAGNVDAKLRQAVQRAHDEASGLRMQMG